MRLLVVLLAMSSLATRWVDGACGCAEHHGWGAVLGALSDEDRHCSHSCDDQPAFDRGCSGEYGRATFVSGDRTQPPVSFAWSSLLPPGQLLLSAGGDAATDSPEKRPLSRTVLQVYRI